MKDTWYADKRDLVKWGTLAHLAQRHSLEMIVQVPFLRPGRRPPLRSGNGEVAIPPEIWAFFRDVSAVESLGEHIQRRIIVLRDAFVPRQRDKYRQQVVAALAALPHAKVVLLDPDTGIEPGKAASEHVSVDDVRAVWQVLKASDWLVLYQHRSRRKAWGEEARSKFAAACGTETTEVFSSTAAADVVFIAARKGQAGDRED